MTSPSSSLMLALRGSELHEVSLAHVRGTARAGEVGSRSWEVTYESYLGKKAVLEQVISAIDRLQLEGEIRDELDVVLFNCGVRPLGAIEERVAFQPRIHEATQPGILPGEDVQIVQPGSQLGDGEQALVLTKARVRVVS
jgi:hypothetical protein